MGACKYSVVSCWAGGLVTFKGWRVWRPYGTQGFIVPQERPEENVQSKEAEGTYDVKQCGGADGGEMVSNTQDGVCITPTTMIMSPLPPGYFSVERCREMGFYMGELDDEGNPIGEDA